MFRVQAYRDRDTGTWWAESTDVRGLVSEAPRLDALIERVSEIVPELLLLNGGMAGPVSLEFHSTQRVELAGNTNAH